MLELQYIVFFGIHATQGNTITPPVGQPLPHLFCTKYIRRRDSLLTQRVWREILSANIS